MIYRNFKNINKADNMMINKNALPVFICLQFTMIILNIII